MHSDYNHDIQRRFVTNYLYFIVADDTAIFSSNTDPYKASAHLQEHFNLFDPWHTQWSIKVNANKSSHVIFTLRKSSCPNVKLYDANIPMNSQTPYLGLNRGKRLTWSPYLTIKGQTTNKRFELLSRLMIKHYKLSLQNKIRFFNLHGHRQSVEVSKIFHLPYSYPPIQNSCPFYVSNIALHSDLEIPFVQDHSNPSPVLATSVLPATWSLKFFCQRPLLQKKSQQQRLSLIWPMHIIL